MSSTPGEVPPEAAAVLQTFLEAGRRRDEPAMRACLTRQSAAAGNIAESGPADGADFQLGEGHFEGEAVIIPVKVVPTAGDAAASADAAAGMEMQCIMVQEDGQWKFDLGQTMDRMMGGSVDAAIEQMANTMGEVMEGVTDALGDAMAEAFGNTDASDADAKEIPNWLEADTAVAEEEFLPLAKMSPLPKTQKSVSEAVGSNVIVQSAMDALLASMGSDERKVLTDWFEDQLFANWGAIFAHVVERVPVKDRLRAIRIETAQMPENRFLALDGSDLVYRIYLNDNSGYHSDDELALLLPGVLAGLPEKIDKGLAGKRLIASDEEYPEFEIFQTRVIPRYMRRISEHLGRNIALDLDPDAIYDRSLAARQLQRWGLNRIYGGIMLAGQDDSLNEALRNDLKTIRITLNSDVTGRNARYADGVLNVGIYLYPGEKGCFYEHDIARVLAGETIQYEEPPADGAAEGGAET